MVILLFGPPGCGKGTQSPMITAALGIPAISTGEMLRAEIAAGTELGWRVHSVLSAGQLAEDHLVNEILVQRLQHRDCEGGFLLDGYPRTVEQAKHLDGILRAMGQGEPLVIHLETPPDVLIERMAARRQCPACSRIYNLQHMPPRREGVCDDDGTALARRRDDYRDIIAHRLKAYCDMTDPVLSYYKGRQCHSVDANREPQKVFAAIEDIMNSAMLPVRRWPRS